MKQGAGKVFSKEMLFEINFQVKEKPIKSLLPAVSYVLNKNASFCARKGSNQPIALMNHLGREGNTRGLDSGISASPVVTVRRRWKVRLYGTITSALWK